VAESSRRLNALHSPGAAIKLLSAFGRDSALFATFPILALAEAVEEECICHWCEHHGARFRSTISDGVASLAALLLIGNDERTMGFARLCFRRRTLQFEQLECRLALSASMSSPDGVVAHGLESLKKPLGYSYPVGLTPAQVRAAYEFNNISFGGVAGDGAGQTIAIIDARNNPNIVHDLAVFDHAFGLPDPPSFTIVNENGGTKLPKKSAGWAQEIALDVEWAHAIAPAANILLVEAKTSSSLGTAIDYARHVPGVTVISVSAGGSEFKSEAAVDALFTTPPGHAGITFVFASGDEGGKAEYPSSSPYVLSVGGTSLDVSFSGQWLGESIWSGGGGGISKYEGVPSYQNGLGLSARGTPDVTYDGDPETGFAVYDSFGSGGWAQFGGTSAGTPQWAALVAIANQGRVLAGKTPLVNAQAALYAMPNADFHDVVSGSNGNPATVGYDLASGLGSPIANLLIPDLVAFNGSTNFTVAALPATNPGGSKSHLTFNRFDFNAAAIAYAPFELSTGFATHPKHSRTVWASAAGPPARMLSPGDTVHRQPTGATFEREIAEQNKNSAPDSSKSDLAFSGFDSFYTELGGLRTAA
jgi:hypothetical protein